MSTPNVNSPAPSARSTQSQTSQSTQGNGTPSTAPDEGYPEQKHAGAVGLGPEYGKGAGGMDKVTGYKEELIGKLFHNPQKAQHGHDLRTGELKRKELEEDEKSNPFQSVDEDDKKVQKDDHDSTSELPKPANSSGPEHPTTEGAKEQAATVAPEGTEDAERQREGQNPKTIG